MYNFEYLKKRVEEYINMTMLMWLYDLPKEEKNEK